MAGTTLSVGYHKQIGTQSLGLTYSWLPLFPMSDSIAALFQRLTLGVYVVGVAHGEARNAFTAAWVMQVSFNPLLLALSIDPHHSSYRLLKEGRAFSVNVLKKGQLELPEHFGRSASSDKLAGIEWTQGCAGLPLLRESLAWFECQLRR